MPVLTRATAGRTADEDTATGGAGQLDVRMVSEERHDPNMAQHDQNTDEALQPLIPGVGATMVDAKTGVRRRRMCTSPVEAGRRWTAGRSQLGLWVTGAV